MGEPRTKVDTLKTIEEIIQSARHVGNQTTIRDLKTNSGVKDTFLDSFLDRLHLAYKSQPGNLAKQLALNNCLATLPRNIISPVWCIEGEHLYHLVLQCCGRNGRVRRDAPEQRHVWQRACHVRVYHPGTLVEAHDTAHAPVAERQCMHAQLRECVCCHECACGRLNCLSCCLFIRSQSTL